MEHAAASVYATPTDLLLAMAQDLATPARSPEGELLARATVIERLRKGTPEQQQTAETLLAGCVNLVSELAVREEQGGWAWGGLDVLPDILTTARTWRALHAAKALDIVVSEKLQARVRAFLEEHATGIPADDYDKKAVLLDALAAAGIADYANAAPLLRVRENLSDCAMAHLTSALLRMERREEAAALLAILETRATRGAVGQGIATASWKGSSTIVRLSEPELVTAAVLWSYAKLQPDSATGAAAANALLGSRAMPPSRGPLCRGEIVAALDAWFAGANDWTEPGYAVIDGAEQQNNPPTVALTAVSGANRYHIQPRDGKRVIVTLLLSGVPKEIQDTKPWEHPEIVSREYFHTGLTYRNAPLNAVGTSPVKNVELGQITRVETKLKSVDESVANHGRYLIWDEPIPACCTVVPGSVEGNFDRVEFLPDRMRLSYAPGVVEPLRYQLLALAPGECAVAPSVISDAHDPTRFRPGPAGALTVLAPGVKSPDVYALNSEERFELAGRTFADGKSAECLEHLDALTDAVAKPEMEKDLARMRLWLLTDTPDGEAGKIVRAFETLSERHPGLVIPFDRILRVGGAYQKLGEHERASQVYLAALDANFLVDSGLAAALEDAADFPGSVDLQERLWRDAADSADSRGALFALTQTLYRTADTAAKLPVRAGAKPLEKNAILARCRDMLTRFITLYPEDELTDDAAFSLTNSHFALKDYAGVTAAAEAAVKRYAASPFLGRFQYMAALGHFWQLHYAPALAAAAPVANGESQDRDFARYITGQIHHAEGDPAGALEWYRKVSSVYPDAADAIAAFEEKRVTLPEISVFQPGAAVSLKVTHRNARDVSLQIYKVDLMRLYLREKNLSRVTSVNLAGIAPAAAVTVDAANAAPWTDHSSDVALPLAEEGAYLVIARADDLFTSGLVLITALQMDVREDAAAGAVRVNVRTAADGKYVADAEVKAIASGGGDIQSGTTDPRGLFEASGLSGTATVIARQGENRFAFHRGTVPLSGAPPAPPAAPATQNVPAEFDPAQLQFDPPQIPQSFGGKVLGKDAYLQNLDTVNGLIQEGNIKEWDSKRRAKGKGVQADKPFKK